mmetsp:Transcript_24080/g.56173  ORF Transcript_24080/g.56173 Transcript_24080/m.56173 type:complete len:102 (-) Transcript_24080:165-470(-)
MRKPSRQEECSVLTNQSESRTALLSQVSHKLRVLMTPPEPSFLCRLSICGETMRLPVHMMASLPGSSALDATKWLPYLGGPLSSMFLMPSILIRSSSCGEY